MFIARTRFSLFLPNAADWIVTRSNDDIDNYKNNLYEKTRLDFRIRFMSTISLPLLERVTKNKDFLHVIEYSISLPSTYVQLLEEFAIKYKFVKLLRYDDNGEPEVSIDEIAIEYFKLHSSDRDIWIGRFILDDDDCVSLNYFEIMQPYLNEPFENFYISSGKGVVGLFDENYTLELCAEIYEPKINIGFMNIGRYNSSIKKLVFNEKRTRHSRMDEVNRVVLDSKEITFFWSRHPLQDTRSNKTERKIRVLLARLRSLPRLQRKDINHHFGNDFYENLIQLELNRELNLQENQGVKNISSSNEKFVFNPYLELGLEEKVRLVITDNSIGEVIITEVIKSKENHEVSFDFTHDVHDYKYKYQILDSIEGKDKWVNCDTGYLFLVNKT